MRDLHNNLQCNEMHDCVLDSMLVCQQEDVDTLTEYGIKEFSEGKAEGDKCSTTDKLLSFSDWKLH